MIQELGRDALLNYLERHLIGPVSEDDSSLDSPPTIRYAVGTLYPQEIGVSEALEGEDVDAGVGDKADGPAGGAADDPVALSSQWMPASVGLSFVIRGDRLTVEASAARYEVESHSAAPIVEAAEASGDPEGEPSEDSDEPASTGRRRKWIRTPPTDESMRSELQLNVPSISEPLEEEFAVFEGRATVHVLWRPLEDARLVTVTLLNEQTSASAKGGAVDLATLFEVALECTPGDGASIAEYPAPIVMELDDEEAELALLYRHRRVFAVGHGCAAGWDSRDGLSADCVRVDWVPRFETPRLVPVRDESSEVLTLARLAAEGDGELLHRILSEFIAPYGRWIEDVATETDVPDALRGAHERVVERLRIAESRIRAGIELLRTDESVRTAFGLANSAVRAAILRDSVRQGEPRWPDAVEPDSIGAERDEPRWFPFQLAFQLSCLPSLLDPGHPDRGTVDLLWFPTGGGKTEAYLGLAATSILHRRLTGGGAGPTVLTRYTLRLLTIQQFQRTATLICAVELLRRSRSDLGDLPIRLGLWIGQDRGTPNSVARAREAIAELEEGSGAASPFQIDRCPWCGTTLIVAGEGGHTVAHGFSVPDNDSFRIRCLTTGCPFSDEIPVQVIDQVIYSAPPEFIVGTVDKFAQLPWQEHAGRILGHGSGLGPSLIIQDELHLLTGPLGTMVGLYEMAVERLISSNGSAPKVIASTATIRRAEDQSRGLFGRDVRAFPPSGTRFGASFFAAEAGPEDGDPGRLYAGVMPQTQTALFAVIQVLAALLQGVKDVERLTEAEKDAYGTIVAYHNSLRELGATMTAARDDVPERLKVYARDDRTRQRLMHPDSVVELNSNVGGEDLVAILNRLSLPVSDPASIALLGTTNMFSVGVDVTRLGMMLMKSQPKTTSEYIQATSRVGRGRVPGLVVVTYSPSRARDRSHYEQFRSFHQALYRWVEPTTVTPFALPARNRALHAVLVALVRHELGLRGDVDAGRFSSVDPRVSVLIEDIVRRVELIDPDEATSAREQLERLVVRWDDAVAAEGARLRYRSSTKQTTPLLKDFYAFGAGWETPSSMRSVDVDTPLRFEGAVEPARATVRRGQVIAPFGPGSILDLGTDGSFVVQGTQAWSQGRLETLRMPRLATELGVKDFRLPPRKGGGSGGLPIRRFPQWLFCERSSCRTMTRWTEEHETELESRRRPRCRKCQGALRPMRYVVICSEGHLDDVDWHRWAHSRSRGICRGGQLKYISRPTSGSPLQWLRVRCEKCGAERDLAEILGKDALTKANISCSGRQAGSSRDEQCEASTQVTPKGASHVHFGAVRSALDIPPDSDDVDLDTDGVRNHTEFATLSRYAADGKNHALVKVMAETIARETGADIAYVLGAAKLDAGVDVFLTRREDDGGDLLQDEWAAFREPHPEEVAGARFVTHREPLDPMVGPALGRLVSDVMVADRLREVRAFTGFTRLEPGGTTVRPDEGAGRDWLPAVEIYGEGVLIRLDEGLIRDWERRPEVLERVEVLESRRLASGLNASLLQDPATPRLVMMHTLAHLLMRQLSFDCGYSSASLRERLYCATDPQQSMAGLLVYTASGDSEGTLGGLAREGSTDRLGRSVVAALRSATWCSVDPICIEATGQGLGAMNRGACHACSLAPETSCTHMNSLLDRALVIGTPGRPSIGFFSSVLEELGVGRVLS
jgi:hypothetical protein